MDGLNTVLEYLTSVPAWYLATSVDGQPHVRPFSFAQIQDGKLWFVTARTKDVWQELLQKIRLITKLRVHLSIWEDFIIFMK